jgi:hypothetical protein
MIDDARDFLSDSTPSHLIDNLIRAFSEIMSNERACHEFLKFECDTPIKAAKFFSNLGQLTKERKVSAKSIENFLDNYFDWHPECSDNAIYFNGTSSNC